MKPSGSPPRGLAGAIAFTAQKGPVDVRQCNDTPADPYNLTRLVDLAIDQRKLTRWLETCRL
jgi:hypothetical protein